MKEKILYYFGAGASARVLPLAKSVYSDNDRAQIPITPTKEGLAYALKDFIPDHVKSKLATDKNKQLDEIQKRFQKLGAKGDEFGDIDTYAKFLHIQQTGSEEMKELKKTLSEY